MQVASKESHGRVLASTGISLALSCNFPFPLLFGLDGLEPLVFRSGDERRDEVVQLIFETLLLPVTPPVAFPRVLAIRDQEHQLPVRATLEIGPVRVRT